MFGYFSNPQYLIPGNPRDQQLNVLSIEPYGIPCALDLRETFYELPRSREYLGVKNRRAVRLEPTQPENKPYPCEHGTSWPTEQSPLRESNCEERSSRHGSSHQAGRHTRRVVASGGSLRGGRQWHAIVTSALHSALQRTNGHQQNSRSAMDPPPIQVELWSTRWYLGPWELVLGLPAPPAPPLHVLFVSPSTWPQAPSQMQFSLQTLLFLQLLFTLPVTAQHCLVCTLSQLQASAE